MKLDEIKILSEAADRTIKVALLDEQDWDEYYNDDTAGRSKVDAFSFKESELEKLGFESWDDIEHGDGSESAKLAAALRAGELGEKLADVIVKNEDFDMGVEGAEAPDGYEILMT